MRLHPVPALWARVSQLTLFSTSSPLTSSVETFPARFKPRKDADSPPDAHSHTAGGDNERLLPMPGTSDTGENSQSSTLRGRYKCIYPACETTTLARMSVWNRHLELHNKPFSWTCNFLIWVSASSRSLSAPGGWQTTQTPELCRHSQIRRDKMREHLCRVHGETPKEADTWMHANKVYRVLRQDRLCCPQCHLQAVDWEDWLRHVAGHSRSFDEQHSA